MGGNGRSTQVMNSLTLIRIFVALVLVTSLSGKQNKEEQIDYFQKWLKEDVHYIIAAEERSVFSNLTADGERERFIEQFWMRRDPDPTTSMNEYREEHYRRIAYANAHYFSGVQGWRTDRGRIYIKFGPPDELESRPTGGMYARPFWEQGGYTSTYPFEKWRYRYLEGVGDDIEIEFVDRTLAGHYVITTNPNDKDALLHFGAAGETHLEMMGLSRKSNRVRMPTNPHWQRNQYFWGTGRMKDQPFDKMLQMTALERPTKLGTPKLKEFVKSKVRFNKLPFRLRSDFVRIDAENYLVLLTIKIPNSELQYESKGGMHRAVLNLYGEFVDMTGVVVKSFEEAVANEIPESELAAEIKRYSLYQRTSQLRPGRYKLQIAITDENSEKLGTAIHLVVVPREDETLLTTSSIIPALRIEVLDEPDLSQFSMGLVKVFPNPESAIKVNSDLPLYFQIYNLSIDQSTGTPEVSVSYTISEKGKEVSSHQDQINGLEGSTLDVVKFLPLEGLPEGKYSLTVNITDSIQKKTIVRSIPFAITS